MTVDVRNYVTADVRNYVNVHTRVRREVPRACKGSFGSPGDTGQQAFVRGRARAEVVARLAAMRSGNALSREEEGFECSDT
ncbi:hypothetical protein GCM10010254_68080 [Streptomyces chromofuscus]|nr:hypothetical protein GCM10010254_68080 [Streptomyces chromofuscus]